VSQINYYKQTGQVCELTGIVDLKGDLTLKDVQQLNALQAHIGRTHWAVIWSDGEMSRLMPLQAEEV
jgi:hypothetical protein